MSYVTVLTVDHSGVSNSNQGVFVRYQWKANFSQRFFSIYLLISTPSLLPAHSSRLRTVCDSPDQAEQSHPWAHTYWPDIWISSDTSTFPVAQRSWVIRMQFLLLVYYCWTNRPVAIHFRFIVQEPTVRPCLSRWSNKFLHYACVWRNVDYINMMHSNKTLAIRKCRMFADRGKLGERGRWWCEQTVAWDKLRLLPADGISKADGNNRGDLPTFLMWSSFSGMPRTGWQNNKRYNILFSLFSNKESKIFSFIRPLGFFPCLSSLSQHELQCQDQKITQIHNNLRQGKYR